MKSSRSKAALSAGEAIRLVRDADLHNLLETRRAWRALRSEAGQSLKQLRVAYLSTYSLNLQNPLDEVAAAKFGLRLQSYYGGFGALEQEALDANSGLNRHEAEVIVIATRLEELAPEWCSSFDALARKDREQIERNAMARIAELSSLLRSRTSATLLVHNFIPPEPHVRPADSSNPLSQASGVSRMNAMLVEGLNQTPDAYVIDVNSLAASTGYSRFIDSRLFAISRMPFSSLAQAELANLQARYLRARVFGPAKCLVLDLDNTLWGGVLGEDGPHGIQLGDDYPGSAFKQFQRACLRLASRGVMLAVCSKNNQEEAVEVIENHPEMLIRMRDLVAVRINWQDKASNIREIARELNIGLESVVLFDDSPVERDWVRDQLPELAVVEAPRDPSLYRSAIENEPRFDSLSLSHDDRMRTSMMKGRAEVERARATAASLEGFLESLQMKATIGLAGPSTFQRIAQLVNKTNQFNLTTRRRTEAEVRELAADPESAIYWMRVTDRYTDNGIVGVAIVVPDALEGAPALRLDTLLLSCRVIGRSLETALVAHLALCARMRGYQLLIGEFVPSGRNASAEEFLESIGFKSIEGGKYCYDLRGGGPELPRFVELTIANESEVTSWSKE
ncbi:MAG TPA: HAD-IIIC family phosphatase, partial [Blastocatellia bacterium]|nr:HAD-IIIC family phosphatase [Blastocatellia bacterium]